MAGRLSSKLGWTICVVALLPFCSIPIDSLRAQERPDCDGEMGAVGYLGISELSGINYRGFQVEKQHTTVFLGFLSEPRVEKVDPSGPANGVLKKGDVIVSIEGHLITTVRGGVLFIDPPVGEPVDLTVRRGAREAKVTIVPEWICGDDPRSFLSFWTEGGKQVSFEVLPELPRPSPPERPEKPDRLASPAAEPSPSALPKPSGFPHPWMGIGLSIWSEGNYYTDSLRFTRPPKVFRVEGASVAKKAGLKPGDVITHIDGIAMHTVEGTMRFANIRPGRRVEFEVLRHGRSRTIEMTAEPTPQWAERLKEIQSRREAPEPQDDTLRFSGVMGGIGIEVRGASPVVVTVDEELGTIVIRTSDSTIRLEKKD